MTADPHALAKKPMLDLRLYHQRYEVGDFAVYITWNLHTSEPCMVITPITRRTILSFNTVTPCVVPLSLAWVWDEHTGDGSHAARSCIQFASTLGMNPSSKEVLFRLSAIIRDALSDLVTCPPLPEDTRVKVADMVVEDQLTGRIIEKEVTDHV